MAVFRRQIGMVSSAWCPASTWCCVSVSRGAQVRRSFLLLLGKVQRVLEFHHSKEVTLSYAQQLWQSQPAPETPMPEAPLIRVLETIDLSSSNIEHFLDSKADLEAFVPVSTAGVIQQTPLAIPSAQTWVR